VGITPQCQICFAGYILNRCNQYAIVSVQQVCQNFRWHLIVAELSTKISTNNIKNVQNFPNLAMDIHRHGEPSLPILPYVPLAALKEIDQEQ
jgi:hypothetical protein